MTSSNKRNDTRERISLPVLLPRERKKISTAMEGAFPRQTRQHVVFGLRSIGWERLSHVVFLVREWMHSIKSFLKVALRWGRCQSPDLRCDVKVGLISNSRSGLVRKLRIESVVIFSLVRKVKVLNTLPLMIAFHVPAHRWSGVTKRFLAYNFLC